MTFFFDDISDGADTLLRPRLVSSKAASLTASMASLRCPTSQIIWQGCQHLDHTAAAAVLSIFFTKDTYLGKVYVYSRSLMRKNNFTFEL